MNTNYILFREDLTGFKNLSGLGNIVYSRVLVCILDSQVLRIYAMKEDMIHDRE